VPTDDPKTIEKIHLQVSLNINTNTSLKHYISCHIREFGIVNNKLRVTLGVFNSGKFGWSNNIIAHFLVYIS
jgi:hypothetical protein